MVDNKGTKTRILDAAERLFASQGMSSTSLRSVTREASANSASIHYYFGSKAALIKEVLERRIGPVNAERLRLLGDVERRAGEGPLPLEPILEAFLGPAIRLKYGKDDQFRPVAQLIGATFSEPAKEVREIVGSLFGGVFSRFGDALSRALPGLDQQELVWRIQFMIGAMAFTMHVPQSLHVFLEIPCDEPDGEIILRRIVRFMAAGMRAAGGASK